MDKHHIFGGSLRKKSEKYGLVVQLCHHDCHIFGEHAVHRNPAERERLQKRGQCRAMQENGWSAEEFVWEFGKNYLDEDELAALGAPEEDGGGFCILPDMELPSWA